MAAQDVTAKAPPVQATLASASDTRSDALPEAPAPQSVQNSVEIPHATRLAPLTAPERAVLESDNPQSKHGDVYTASGNVVLTYAGHVLYADSLSYNAETGDVTFDGHVRVTGGDNDEYIEASHGSYNLKSGTGKFYDVHGSVGFNASAPVAPSANPRASVTGAVSGASPRESYATANPFLFEGRLVVKTGPQDYTVYDGSVTSCLLPHPDWQIFAKKIVLEKGRAHAADSTFRLVGIPMLFLPYVTHPVDSETRQSGLLIPVVGFSSASKDTGSKGITLGEQVYLVLGRSADLTLGTLYYSLRGFSENGTFRYRGPNDDFFTAHFSALEDRGFHTPSFNQKNQPINLYVNQGGQDVTTGFRRQLAPNVRAVGDLEYLSSYIYREVFTENFNQAVSSDIDSVLYVTQQKNGYSFDGLFDRYQGLKVVPIGTNPGFEVKIFHAPSIDFTAVDHPIAGTPLRWSMRSSVSGLKRIQPNFVSSGMTERMDLRPELSLPLAFAGWHMLSSAAVRETFYSRSREAPYGPNATPVELTAPVNRADLDLRVDVRPPVIERTFHVAPKLQHLLGDEVRHTVEAKVFYRDTHGVDNFLNVLRFDDKDLESDTNELQYGVTQHLYFRPHAKPEKRNPACRAEAGEAAKEAEATAPQDALDNLQQPSNDANGIPNASATAPDVPTRTHARHADPCAPAREVPKQREWFSWELAQKHFFDQTFNHAVIKTRRNIFDTTLDFSGIAFLTEPRSISPLLSRMRFRTSSHTDFEWDFNYDTGATKFTSSNVFVDLHEGAFFGGFSYALLNAPGRFYTEVINTTTNTATGLTRSAISDFSQMRLLAGYGTPSKPGLSAAAGAGIDVNLGTAQYITLQTSYNWNCCGISLEYRKYDLGTVRNEGAYRFNFTLANIGTAGNLRRAQSLF